MNGKELASGWSRREWMGAAIALPALGVTRRARVDLLHPRLRDPNILRYVAGLRPRRLGGVRLESERIGDKTVVHNYGHGGSGVTLSWGSAEEAVDLVSAAVAPPAEVAVLGAGAVGLATARVLQEKGYTVTVYAKDFPPHTTSNLAGAAWHPGNMLARTIDANKDQLKRMLHRSWDRFAGLVGDQYGIERRQSYEHYGHPRLRPEEGTPLEYRPVERLPFAGGDRSGFVTETFLIAPPVYLPELIRQVLIAGGKMEPRTFASPEDLAGLTQSVAVDCMGLGAKAVFGDARLVPVRGQLVHLFPEPLDYLLTGRHGYLFPRKDAVVLGGTFEVGEDDPTPDDATCAEILDKHRQFFGLLVLLLALLVPGLPAQPPGFRAENVVQGLDLASAMAFAPDGRLFVLERTAGDILTVEGGAVTGVWAHIPVDAIANESKGLLGIAVDPGFLQNGFVYVAVSNRTGANDNVVMRLQDVGGVGTNATAIGPSMAVSRIHNIGPMVFGVDGKLYVHTGDGTVPATAPNLASLHGKMLRLEVPSGAVPTDNPFAGSYVWSSGHRNGFGLAVHPETGALYETENGDVLADEVNLISKGADYGWPAHEGNELVPDPSAEDPVGVWAPTVSPTGSCFYTGELYPAPYRDGWFMADFNHGQITFLDLDAAGTALVGTTMMHDYAETAYGVVYGPDGNLWTLYSTGSGRGADRIDRLVYDPGPSPALAVSALCNVAVGGSMTIGITGQNGDLAVAWVGGSRFVSPTATVFGDWWVPFQVVLPSVAIAADDRVYIGVSLLNDPSFVGVTIHVQGAVVSGGQARFTNPDALKLH